MGHLLCVRLQSTPSASGRAVPQPSQTYTKGSPFSRTCPLMHEGHIKLLIRAGRHRPHIGLQTGQAIQGLLPATCNFSHRGRRHPCPACRNMQTGQKRSAPRAVNETSRNRIFSEPGLLETRLFVTRSLGAHGGAGRSRDSGNTGCSGSVGRTGCGGCTGCAGCQRRAGSTRRVTAFCGRRSKAHDSSSQTASHPILLGKLILGQ